MCDSFCLEVQDTRQLLILQQLRRHQLGIQHFRCDCVWVHWNLLRHIRVDLPIRLGVFVFLLLEVVRRCFDDRFLVLDHLGHLVLDALHVQGVPLPLLSELGL